MGLLARLLIISGFFAGLWLFTHAFNYFQLFSWFGQGLHALSSLYPHSTHGTAVVIT